VAFRLDELARGRGAGVPSSSRAAARSCDRGRRVALRYRRDLAVIRYGPGAFKLDYGRFDGGPCRGRGGECRAGGNGAPREEKTLEQIAGVRARTWRMAVIPAQSPYVMCAGRGPVRREQGGPRPRRRTRVGYCQVPNGSTATWGPARSRNSSSSPKTVRTGSATSARAATRRGRPTWQGEEREMHRGRHQGGAAKP